MDQIDKLIDSKRLELASKNLLEIQDKYKNYKNSPLGKEVVPIIRNKLNLPYVKVYSLTGKLITKSMKKYDNLKNSSKISTFKILRVEIQKQKHIYLQTLEHKEQIGYVLLREFKKVDNFPCWYLRPEEPNIGTIKDKQIMSIDTRLANRRIKAGNDAEEVLSEYPDLEIRGGYLTFKEKPSALEETYELDDDSRLRTRGYLSLNR